MARKSSWRSAIISRLLEGVRGLLRRDACRPAGDAALGAAGESLAVAELRRKHYKIIGTHVRSPIGEIDIVARDAQTVVFVEVKTRESADPFDPLEAVTSAKRKQLTRLALAYLTRHRLHDSPSRFDVVAICWPPQGRPQVRHVINAFEATGRGQMYS